MVVDTVWLSATALTVNDPRVAPVKVPVAAPFTYVTAWPFSVPAKEARPFSELAGTVVPLLRRNRSAVSAEVPPTFTVEGEAVS